ncbi:MFS transporter [Poriferisphaera sp. WC338]|uniref:MFS transporter n=1 Tax=Poriferisphaera sp. WC338 TaxID=3425129 RepID=UPI003D81BF19
MTKPIRTMSQPLMARQSYRHEMMTVMFFPIAMSLVEGSVIAVLADKTFGVGKLGFATIVAAPMFANLTSFIWTWLARGRKKVGFIASLMIGLCLTLCAIATLPASPTGGLLLVALVILARCLLSGVTTLRSTIWRQNYPKHSRASITSKFAIVVTLILAISPILIYRLLDNDPMWFRYVYPLAALVAVIGPISFSRIRLRGEKEILTYERGEHLSQPSNLHRSLQPGNQPKEKTGHLRSFYDVLHGDKYFRSYMTWLFILGIGNMTAEIAIIRLIIRYTDGMKYEYMGSILLTTTVPMILAMLSMPLWAKYLDKVHITKFRRRHILVIAAGVFGYWFACLTGIVWMIILPRIISGAARGGGILAWQLGHHDFADKKLVSVYMGIHVTLTGIRGAFCAYLAVLFLDGISPIHVLDFEFPGWQGMGENIFLLSGSFCMIAWLGFTRLERRIRHAKQQDVERTISESEVSTTVTSHNQ